MINKKHLLLSALSVVFSLSLVAQNNPVANPAAVVTSGNARFTVLTPEMIRIEYSEKKQFEDRASFVVINRNLEVPQFTQKEEAGELVIKTEKLELRYKKGTYPVTDDRCEPNLTITMTVGGETIGWYPGKPDPYNLKGTMRTLDTYDGDVRYLLEDGLVSRSGWAVINERQPRRDGSYSLMFDGKAGTNGLGFDWVEQRKDPDALDMYFMGYGHDYKKALYDFTRIAGKIPLPPRYIFGYWYSKYQRYSEQDLRDIVTEIKENDIPMDVLVIDMDWHRAATGSTADGQNTWTGWSWNKELFPDPEGFIRWLHDQNLYTTLNLHPADGVYPGEDNYQALKADLEARGYDMAADSLVNQADKTIRWNIENKDFYQAMFKNILRPHENIGVDFWWLDWQQWMIAKNEKNLGNTFWLNHVFYNDMAQNRPDKRPFIFHRWGGLGNHRYPIGFSGDSYASFGTLEFQPYFTATASNVGYAYWGHDIGGHNQNGDNNPELYLRWIQYGVFSPLLRTHATNHSNIERRIWVYPNFPQMREAVRLRYKLIPYIYTMARVTYDEGLGLCRPMYYDYPESEEAYSYEGQYMFGDDILAAPILESDGGTGSIDKTVWLPAGCKWYEVPTGRLLDGGQVITHSFTRDDIPYYYKEGAIIPLYPKVSNLATRPETLTLQVVPGATGEFKLYEDEGDNADYDTQYTKTKFLQKREGNTTTLTINARTGEFEGMPAERAYRVEMLACDKAPTSVTFSGEKGTFEYDAAGKKLVISVPKQACSETITVTIQN